MQVARFLAVTTALGAAAPACSSSGSPAGTAPTNATDAAPIEADLESCQTDKLAETYSADMMAMGASHNFQFVLVSSDPAPPALDSNTWVIKLLDMKGNPIPNATFPSIWGPGWSNGVRPYMPYHGHASSIQPTITSNNDGTYTIAPVYLYMGGLWQVTINAQVGTTTDSAVFGFCIGG